MDYQDRKVADPSTECEPINAMHRKVFADHRLCPTREEYEAAIDAAIAAREGE